MRGNATLKGLHRHTGTYKIQHFHSRLFAQFAVSFCFYPCPSVFIRGGFLLFCSVAIAENRVMPICFDLDGTLGSFRGGYTLLRETVGELMGDMPTQEELEACVGSTDWEIVDELHRNRFGSPIGEHTYAAYEKACLARFEGLFDGRKQSPVAHHGLIRSMTALLDMGYCVSLVSGNTPRILAFKATRLGIDARVTQIGSLPHHSRADLIGKAMRSGPHPHLYVGDRPHDLDAASEVGIPFLAVGDLVPGPHPSVAETADPGEVVELVRRIAGTRSTPPV
jgi:phosphoglycolate phosphatase-like HAD superfamily hydrolase